MVSVNKNSGARLEIAYMKDSAPLLILADDEHICGAKSGRGNVAVVHTLLHKGKRLTAVLLHLLNDGNDKFGIYIGDLLDLLCVIFLGLRTLHTLLQILANLVLTDLMGVGSLGGVDRAFVRKILLQTD